MSAPASIRTVKLTCTDQTFGGPGTLTLMLEADVMQLTSDERDLVDDLLTVVERYEEAKLAKAPTTVSASAGSAVPGRI